MHRAICIDFSSLFNLSAGNPAFVLIAHVFVVAVVQNAYVCIYVSAHARASKSMVADRSTRVHSENDSDSTSETKTLHRSIKIKNLCNQPYKIYVNVFFSSFSCCFLISVLFLRSLVPMSGGSGGGVYAFRFLQRKAANRI